MGSRTRVRLGALGLIAIVAFLVFRMVRHGDSDSAALFGKPKLTVVVVEEHHEVLPYWELAHGPIQVLHVDAHDDASPPVTIRKDLREFMAANDVFVLGSSLLGKLKAFTWVWPSWDVQGPTHRTISKFVETHQAEEVRFVTKTGWFQVENVNGVTIKMGCQCMYYRKSGERVQCEIGDDSYEDGFKDKYLVSPMSTRGHAVIEKNCHFEASMETQHIMDTDMVKGKFVPLRLFSPEKVVLDIDLDFFGVMGPLDSAFGFGALKDAELRKVEDALSYLDVKTVADEDRVNQQLRREVMRMWQLCWEGGSPKPKCQHTESFVFPGEMLNFLRPFHLVLFEKDARAVNYMSSMSAALFRMVRSSPNAASVLMSTGFCLKTTPATYYDPTGGYDGGRKSEDRGMKLCGDRPEHWGRLHNDGSAAAVAASNSPFELRRRLEILRLGLEKINHPVELVTICRSIRDGYALPALWEQMEAGLLEVLEKVYGPIEVHYDKNLMGGPKGWTEHAKPIIV